MSALSFNRTTSGALIVMACAVGDTLVEETVILRVHGAQEPLDEKRLMKAVHLGIDRTFEQDPKYAIRLWGDIAIKALSPAINDPTTAVQALESDRGPAASSGASVSDSDNAIRAARKRRMTWTDPVPY
jgi:uncharacterized membrane protein